MAIYDKDCFLKGFITGQDLKLHKGGTGSGGGSASSGTPYDKASFLSGLAAGMASMGVHKGRGDFNLCLLVRDSVTFRLQFRNRNVHGPTVIDWGDGTQTTYPENEPGTSNYVEFSHTYSDSSLHVLTITEPSEYHISITGDDYGVIKALSPFPSNYSWHKSLTPTFYRCRNLESIPGDLYDYMSDDIPSVSHHEFFEARFSRCSSLTAIPAGLFDDDKFDNIHVLGEYLSAVFADCSSITSIPDGLFDNFHANTSFEMAFQNCTSLTDIPEGLFDNCTHVKNFAYCFEGCTSLTSIPEGLFDNCMEATDFTRCFRNCTNLTGEAPALWERSGVNGWLCFQNCTGLSNYADIPARWKTG